MKNKFKLLLVLTLFLFNVTTVYAKDTVDTHDIDVITQEKNNKEETTTKVTTTKRVKIELDGPNGCNNILGDEGTRIFNNILKTIQYAGPILVAIMTIIDLVKVSISGDKEGLTKLHPKFIKRLVAAMLLFFIPLLINLVFDFVGIDIDKICI